jgi:glycosyltransferase involved in cell wall biosynthesis
MRVGIVTPAWNMAPWIGAAIRSVLAQTHVDWRMVVVDDGSTDGTPDVVWALSDERLTLLRQVHEGVSAARNRGLLALEPGCEAILFLDADDQLTPNALTRLVAGCVPPRIPPPPPAPVRLPGVCCARRSAICSSRCCTATPLPMAGTCCSAAPPRSRSARSVPVSRTARTGTT